MNPSELARVAAVAAAQKEFVRRAGLTALAATGRYASDMESRAA